MTILAIVIVALLVERWFAERGWRSERQRLVNAVVARNAHELAGLDAATRVQPRQKKEREPIPEQVGA